MLEWLNYKWQKWRKNLDKFYSFFMRSRYRAFLQRWHVLCKRTVIVFILLNINFYRFINSHRSLNTVYIYIIQIFFFIIIRKRLYTIQVYNRILVFLIFLSRITQFMSVRLFFVYSSLKTIWMTLLWFSCYCFNKNKSKINDLYKF